MSVCNEAGNTRSNEGWFAQGNIWRYGSASHIFSMAGFLCEPSPACNLPDSTVCPLPATTWASASWSCSSSPRSPSRLQLGLQGLESGNNPIYLLLKLVVTQHTNQTGSLPKNTLYCGKYKLSLWQLDLKLTSLVKQIDFMNHIEICYFAVEQKSWS